MAIEPAVATVFANATDALIDNAELEDANMLVEVLRTYAAALQDHLRALPGRKRPEVASAYTTSKAENYAAVRTLLGV